LNINNKREYFKQLQLVQLDYLLENYEKERVNRVLKTFKCLKNRDLEDFLHTKSIFLEEKNITKTYLYLDNRANVIAYYAICLKVLNTLNLSKSMVKKLDGIDKNRKNIPCFLIAQLGKTDSCEYKIGQNILDEAINLAKNISRRVGGRFIILDSVNIKKVINFYTSEPNNFVILNKKSETSENITMYYPIL